MLSRSQAGKDFSYFLGWLGRVRERDTPAARDGLRRSADRVSLLLRTYPDLPELYRIKLRAARAILRS